MLKKRSRERERDEPFSLREGEKNSPHPENYALRWEREKVERREEEVTEMGLAVCVEEETELEKNQRCMRWK